MHHEIKKLNDTKTIILFIHGICGSPNHFVDLIDIVPQDISVYNILLDGHGKKTKDFSKTSMKMWENQVEKIIFDLTQKYENIYIVAHSMGTLFSIDHALKNSKIKGLFFLASPLKLFLKPKMSINAIKLYLNIIKENDLEVIAAKERCSISLDKNPFKYLGWIPRFIDLFRKIRKTRKNIDQLETNCIAIQSYRDEVVSRRAVKYLNKSKNMNIIMLEKSSHYYYDSNDYILVLEKFKEFVDLINK